MPFELTLDASISFGRRPSKRLPSEAALQHDYGREHYDFLGLITAVAHLYGQQDVLEMQGRRERGRPLSRGAVSEVSYVDAAFTQPSRIISHQIRTQRRVVVIKQSESKLFLPNGQHNDQAAIRSFISEIQILSHADLRRHRNIVTILGIHWDYFESGYPEPLMLIEKANLDLRKFQAKNSSLPFSTKKSIGLDIAQGLSALHRCGVIHGDMKPANILIFYQPELHAKIADFSHSFLDTGVSRKLEGGTWAYAAPEWRSMAPTGRLMKTDIYSFGLIFSGLVLGSDLVTTIAENNRLSHLQLSTEELIRMHKDDDSMSGFLYDTICQADRDNPDLHLQELSTIKSILDATLPLDPCRRDLERALALLSGSKSQITETFQKLPKSLESNAISIPYTALQNVSPVVMDQIVRALENVAGSATDTRRAAACLELAICHFSDLARPAGLDYGRGSAQVAMEYFIKSASLGDTWARTMLYRVSRGLEQPIPSHHPLKDWLYDAAVHGSSIALDSLRDVDIDLHRKAKETFRTTFCGNPEQPFLNMHAAPLDNLGAIINDRGDTVLHWIASTAQHRILESLSACQLQNSTTLNAQNHQGDTPLICSARAGHFGIVAELVGCNADASIQNEAGENALHFLGRLDKDNVFAAAELLIRAGASMHAEATSFTGNLYLETRPMGAGCPKLRAVLADEPHVLSALFEIQRRSASGVGETPASVQRLMLTWALQLHHDEILRTLQEYLGDSSVFHDIAGLRFWSGDRRQSLVELCIRGCAVGSGLPEAFFRLLNHGERHTACLEFSISFLMSARPGILEMPCAESRNALFFAIREGRRAAARILSHPPAPEDVTQSLFRTARSPSARLGELQRQMIKIEQESLLQESRRERILETYCPADFMGRARKFVFIDYNMEDYRLEDENAYAPVSLSKKERDRLTRARMSLPRRSPILPPGSFSDFSDSDSSDEEDPELSVGSPQNDFVPDLVRRDNSFMDKLIDEYNRPALRSRIEAEGTQSHPRGPNEPTYLCEPSGEYFSDAFTDPQVDHYSLGGYVDAILLAILHGRRAIFCDLLDSGGRELLEATAPFPCHIYMIRDQFYSHDVRSSEGFVDLRGYFPTLSWNYIVTKDRLRNKHVVEVDSDGSLSYPLIYMAVIARSVHRDIAFAHILLSTMEARGIPEPAGWTGRNTFEDECLSLDLCSGQTSALYHAAALRWDDLSLLLLNHGATPQSACFHFSSSDTTRRKSTVLARLIGATRNAQHEVQHLLDSTVGIGLESAIVARDIYAIFNQTSSRDLQFRWCQSDDGVREVLSWSDSWFWHEDRHLALWQTIVAANKSQLNKVQFTKSNGALLVEAARDRDFWAVNTLLDLEIYPNAVVGHWWNPFRPRTSALDHVAWTEHLSTAQCDEGGRELKRRDAQLAALLRKRGAKRSIDYTVEYHIFSHLILALVAGGACYIAYLIAPVIPLAWSHSFAIAEECNIPPDSEPDPKDIPLLIAFPYTISFFLQTFGLFVLCALPSAFMESSTRRETESPFVGALIILVLLVVMDAICKVAPCWDSNEVTQQVRDLLRYGYLFNAMTLTFLVLSGLVVCLMVMAISGYWCFRCVKWLGIDLVGADHQPRHPAVLFRAATISSLRAIIAPLLEDILHLAAPALRYFRIQKSRAKLAWGGGRRRLDVTGLGLAAIDPRHSDHSLRRTEDQLGDETSQQSSIPPFRDRFKVLWQTKQWLADAYAVSLNISRSFHGVPTRGAGDPTEVLGLLEDYEV